MEMLAESKNLYIVGRYDEAIMYFKGSKRRLACVGEFGSYPSDAYIDPEEKFCIVIGTRIIKYFLIEPYDEYALGRTSSHWVETTEIEYYKQIDEVTASYIAVTLINGEKKKYDVNTLEEIKEDK